MQNTIVECAGIGPAAVVCGAVVHQGAVVERIGAASTAVGSRVIRQGATGQRSTHRSTAIVGGDIIQQDARVERVGKTSAAVVSRVVRQCATRQCSVNGAATARGRISGQETIAQDARERAATGRSRPIVGQPAIKKRV